MSFLESIQSHIHLPSPLTLLETDWSLSAGINLFIKRDELIHPHICGNKWRKLKGSIAEMTASSEDTMITFGGAYSNHLVAVAAAGHFGGFETVGIVRSYKKQYKNPTLDICKSYGMQLHFINPKEYVLKLKSKDVQWILIQYSNYKIVPEGGTSHGALEGVGELYEEIKSDLSRAPDYLACAVGTGGTLAGLAKSACSSQIIGLYPLKGSIGDLPGLHLLDNGDDNYRILPAALSDLRFGRYDESLVRYINDFKQHHHIQLDPIYTARAMMRLEKLCKTGYFPSGSTLVFIHTGGLQGVEGFNHQYRQKSLHIKD